jgi:hypothetical protein
MSPLNAIKHLVKDVGDPWFWYWSRRSMEQILTSVERPDGRTILRICDEYRGSGWYGKLHHLQLRSEFTRLVDWAARFSPKVTVEIGSFCGATLLGWARVTQGMVVSVDLPGGFADQRQKLFRMLNHPGVRPEIFTVLADSQLPSTRAQVEALLAGRQVDLLFIDGAHEYAAVRKDFDLWSPLVRSGGVVIFHDILEMRGSTYGVHLLWSELKRDFQTEEIVEDRNQNGFGIGILHVP